MRKSTQDFYISLFRMFKKNKGNFVYGELLEATEGAATVLHEYRRLLLL